MYLNLTGANKVKQNCNKVWHDVESIRVHDRSISAREIHDIPIVFFMLFDWWLIFFANEWQQS